MASNKQEYLDMISAEVFVELDKLRDSARHGVPDEIRGEVWCYLLGVFDPDKSKEMSQARAREQEYRSFNLELMDSVMATRLKAEVKRYQAELDKSREGEVSKTVEHVISAYINLHRGMAYSPLMVHICGPLACCIKQEAHVYFAFERVMSLLDLSLWKNDTDDQMATFAMLFRTVVPDVLNHFEEEDINNNEWAVSWVSGLLARELPLRCLLRLWDLYFASADHFALHVYVCLVTGSTVLRSARAALDGVLFITLAVLKKFKDELEDLEHSEILSFLRRLPALDMDQIITEAYNIKDDVQQANL